MSPERVFYPSLKHFVVNTSATLGAVTLLWPILRLSRIHAGPFPSWLEIAWQVPFFLVVDDFLFYWLHRALHTRWLYDHVHFVHHRITTPWAIVGAYFHPVEYLSITSLVLLGPLLVGAHVVTLWIWIVFREWESAEGHSGFEFPWNPTRWLPGYEGPSFHDFHHARFRGNYANYFGCLDRWLSTQSPGYDEHRRNGRAA